MKINTDYVGTIEFEESDIISFEEGLYGFGSMKKFIIVNNPEEELPFHWLQSLQDERLAFIITSPFLFVEKYEFDLPESAIESLEIKDESEIIIYSITVIPDDVVNTTINLKAPIVMNTRTKKAKQIILAEDYPYKHSVFTK